MSDFLTNLVSRSFGAAPVVRPRLTSLFEPVRRDEARFRSAPEMKHRETLEAVEEEVAEGANEDDRKPRSRVARIAVDEYQQQTMPIQEDPPQPVVARSPRSVQEPQRAAAVERTEGDNTNLLTVPTRRNAPDRVPVAAAITEHEHGLVKPALATSVILPISREPLRQENRHELLISPKLTPEMRIPDLALSARSDRRSRDKERNFLSGPTQPSEQTVNVTIGRIEVRATKENSHSTRPASPSPVMSLDEYLRNRARQAGS